MVEVMRMMLRTVMVELKRGEDESNLKMNLMSAFWLKADIGSNPVTLAISRSRGGMTR